MNDLQKARRLLESGGYTCVLNQNDRVLTSNKRGVAPLLELLDGGTDVRGFSAADKVVGKATALLYCLLGVNAVYAAVISEAALGVLQAGGIEASWGQCVPYIVNRAGDGRCPMETATAAIDDPALAPAAIRKKLEELRKV